MSEAAEVDVAIVLKKLYPNLSSASGTVGYFENHFQPKYLFALV